jgi:hypothetical protein
MYRLLTLAAAFVVAVVSLSLPASAKQDEPDRSDWFAGCQIEYLNAYEKAHEEGFDVGANLVDDHNAGCAEIAESTARLKAWLNPPEPEPVASEPTATTAYAPASSGAPVDINCESGGDYSINTGNGYFGAYQFDSQTWDAYGDPAYGEANEAPPAVQDAAAASVPYDAWPNC